MEKSESEKRLILVQRVNGAQADLEGARQRQQSADASYAKLKNERGVLVDKYMSLRVPILDTLTTVERRLELFAELEALVLEIEAVSASLQRAKSEQGTARALAEKAVKQHEEAHSSLLKFLPEF